MHIPMICKDLGLTPGSSQASVSAFFHRGPGMTAPASQLKVDYKPSGEPYIHTVRPAPLVRHRYWLLLAGVLAGAGGFQFFSAHAAGSPAHDIRAALAAPSSAPAEIATTPDQITATATPASSPAPANAMPAPSGEITELKVRRGDNLAGLFAEHQLNPGDLHAILALGSPVARLKRIRVGETIRVQHDADGRVLGLSLQLDEAHTLDIRRGTQGYTAQVSDIPTDISLAYGHGVIENSLFDSATRAGLDDPVTMQLIHIFGWDIDFAHDIQSGDSFTVLYQKIHRQGQPVTDGPIVAAEFVTRDKTYRVVRFTDSAGHSNYYTPDGHSVRKTLLRAPIDYTRISSGFSLHRLNPVLHYVRPHYGVDYAAPMGTPIKAAGDGRIAFRGWKTGFGNCIIIDHGGGYSTLYGHMSHFRRGLHAGSHVQQDQVIGYVGETGEATGPHLHYQIMLDGVPRNPRTVKLPNAAPIPVKFRPEFELDANTLLAELSNGGEVRIASAANSGSTGKVGTAH